MLAKVEQRKPLWQPLPIVALQSLATGHLFQALTPPIFLLIPSVSPLAVDFSLSSQTCGQRKLAHLRHLTPVGVLLGNG